MRLQAGKAAAAALAAFSTSRSPHSGKMPTVSRVSMGDLESKEGRSPSTSRPPIQLNPMTVFPWLDTEGGLSFRYISGSRVR